jgi:hypothetical protein
MFLLFGAEGLEPLYDIGMPALFGVIEGRLSFGVSGIDVGTFFYEELSDIYVAAPSGFV